jgi:hypothetical protein
MSQLTMDLSHPKIANSFIEVKKPIQKSPSKAGY